MTMAPLVVHDKVIVGISGGEFGVRGCLLLRSQQRQAGGRAYSVGPDEDIMFDPAKTIDGATQQPVGKDSSLKTWQADEWKLGGGTTWGWYTTIRSESCVLRYRQPRHMESHTASGGQQMVYHSHRTQS